MKQTYIVGIIIALSVLVVMGLSRLFPERDFDQRRDSARESNEVGEVDIRVSPEEQVTERMTKTPMDEAQNMAKDETRRVVMRTNKGDIALELAVGAMPVTTANFLKLAEENFYDQVKFHRVIEGFMIQGGDPLTKDETKRNAWGTGGPGYTIQDEFDPRLRNVRGTIAMANAGPNTGGSQFFINTVDNTSLDDRHPVFGQVIEGMDVVDMIASVSTGDRDVPIEPVYITDIIMSNE